MKHGPDVIKEENKRPLSTKVINFEEIFPGKKPMILAR